MTTATSAPLHALRFTGHDGRTLVRLVPEQLVTAEDLALASVGVTREVGKSDRTVGTTTVRAVGFPAWPIITDPGNARHALNLVGDLEWARRNASSRAGDVKTRFDTLAADLTKAAPHFVPTLLEELSRIFDTAGNQTYARQYFGKARETERSHNVPVDPERHRAMFTEFAGAGIVGAKEMTAECTASLDRFDDPADAFAHVLDIMASLTAAGNGPYAGMARDVRKVATAAGISAADADEKLLDAVLNGKGFTRATAGALKALKTSLPRYLTAHPDAAASFAQHRPGNMEVEDFLAVLDSCGQLDRLRTGDSYATWLLALVTDHPYDFGEPTPLFYAEVGYAASGIADLPQTPVDLWPLHPALVDALLSAGLDIVPEDVTYPGRHRVNISNWYRHPYGNLDALAADPVFGPTLLGSRPDLTEIGDHLEELLAHSGTRALLARRVADLAQVRGTLTGALPTLGAGVERVLEPLADPRIAELAPEAVAELFAFDPAEEFAAAVRSGLLTEYTWPGFEDAYRRMAGHAADWAEKHPAPAQYRDTADGVRVFNSYPHVAVTGGEHIEVVGSDGVIFAGTGPFGGATVSAVYTLGDTGVVVYQDRSTWTPYNWWFGEPAAVPASSSDYWSVPDGHRVSVPVGGTGAPGRLLVSGMLRPGGDFPDDPAAAVIDVPGDVVCTVTGWGHTVRRYSRGTGELLDTTDYDRDTEVFTALGIDTPGGLLDQVGYDPSDPTTAHVIWAGSSIVELPDGVEDGPVGQHDRRQVILGFRDTAYGSADVLLTPLGRVDATDTLDPWARRQSPGLPFRLPGGGLVHLVDGSLSAPQTGAPLSASMTASGVRHALHRLPAHLGVALNARHDAASARMRGYTPAQARTALAALSPDPARTVPTVTWSSPYSGDSALSTTAVPAVDAVRTVLAEQLGLATDSASDAALLDALVHLAADTAALDENYTRLRATVLGETGTDATAGVPGATLTDDGACAFENSWSHRWSPADLLRQGFTWLRDRQSEDGYGGDPQVSGNNAVTIARYLGREKLLIAQWRHTLTGVDGEDLSHAVDFARELVVAGILGGDWDIVTVAAPADARTLVALGDVRPGWVDLGAPVHPFGGRGRNRTMSEGSPVQVMVKREERDRLTVPVLPGSARAEDHLDADALLAALDDVAGAIPENAEAAVEADQAAALAGATGLAEPTCRLLLGGIRGAGSMDAALRKRYGVTVAQAQMAENQVRALDDAVRDALLIASLDASIPAAGMAARWQELTGDDPLLTLTDEEWLTVDALDYGWHNATRMLTRRLLLGTPDFARPPLLVAAVLAVIAGLSLADPRRPAFADLLRWMVTAAEEYVADPEHAKGIGTMDIGCPGDDPAFKGSVTPEKQAVRVLTEGLLDGLIEDLEQVHPEFPGAVNDPGNSVPDLVAEVASSIAVGEDAARYLLQLLALSLPTDASVRGWNGWKKKDIEAAGAELVAAGVVVQAKRAGAGRSFFLPGGWLEGRGGYEASKPMEVWKAPMYLLWADVKARPVVIGCPPHVPVASLFRTAWKRYSSGDVPGYEDLSTTRYRSGGRSRR